MNSIENQNTPEENISPDGEFVALIYDKRKVLSSYIIGVGNKTENPLPYHQNGSVPDDVVYHFDIPGDFNRDEEDLAIVPEEDVLKSFWRN